SPRELPLLGPSEPHLLRASGAGRSPTVLVMPPHSRSYASFARAFVRREASAGFRGGVRRAPADVEEPTVQTAGELLTRTKIGIFSFAFQAERVIVDVLSRIPPAMVSHFADITVVEDSSRDSMFDAALAAGERLGLHNLHVLGTPSNRGYGGNQKLGYLHAIELDLDYVILLPGDGQYAPEGLPQIVSALADRTVDAVIASRMMNRWDALRGGMPVHEWLANQALTKIQNRMLR